MLPVIVGPLDETFLEDWERSPVVCGVPEGDGDTFVFVVDIVEFK